MCGRFVFSSENDGDRIISVIEDNLPGINGVSLYLNRKGDVYPSQNFPVILDKGGYQVEDMIWGYPPASKKSKQLLINARSETADEKYTFKNDFYHRRCIIPATGFYEWSKHKDKYLFTDSEKLLFIGGLYTDKKYKDRDEDRFVILTKEPDETVARIHNRMPVLIPPPLLSGWLTELDVTEEVLRDNFVNLIDYRCP